MTLLIQARHIFYGISMLEHYKGLGWKKYYIIYGMCDESFSINYTANIPDDVDKGWFMFFVTLLNQLFWCTGATLGGLVGSLLKFDTTGVSFVMTAMFVVIFLEQWLKEKSHFFIDWYRCRYPLPYMLWCRFFYTPYYGGNHYTPHPI